MANLADTIESLLLVSNRPLQVRELANLCEASPEHVDQAITQLAQQYAQRPSGGIIFQRSGSQVQLATNGACTSVVQRFLKAETTGELTRAQLEALTIIAYRGPVTRAELEQIRGVNCAIILRNLQVRGLVEAQDDRQAAILRYVVSLEFLRSLGFSSVVELPDYQRLHGAEVIQRLLETTPAA